jgi:hypothetical protein
MARSPGRVAISRDRYRAGLADAEPVAEPQFQLQSHGG